jgi:hypothetical protein
VSDATQRRAFEAAQVEVEALKRTLAERPAANPRIAELERDVQRLRLEVPKAEKALADARTAETRARNKLDSLRPDRRIGGRPWWQSRLATPAIIVGAIGAWPLANWSLDYINWPYWADRLAFVFCATPLAVTLIRLVLVGLRSGGRRGG